MVALIYRILFLPLFLLMLPYYAVKMWRRGGYAKDFDYRFGFLPIVEKCEKKRVWLQAVSVGEVKAIGRLIDYLIADGRFEVILTTTSSTGYALARELYASKVLFVGLFPWDFYPFSKLAWKRICPDVIILMESELWPEHLCQARKHGVPVYLVNARMSDASFARYSRLRMVARALFSNLTKIIASSADASARFIKLGATRSKVLVSGNMKFDCEVPRMQPFEKRELRAKLGFPEDSLILLGSSTWPEEEEWLIKCFLTIRKETKKDWRLLIVPRHVERRLEIIGLLKKSAFSWHQRSSGYASKFVDICLADTTGELFWLTSVADLAFIGKSLFKNKGGQSPLDAAAHGVPIVYGTRMTNFRAICESLESIGAAVKANDEEAAKKALLSLAADTRKRGRLSTALSNWYASNCGATEYTYRAITKDIFDVGREKNS